MRVLLWGTLAVAGGCMKYGPIPEEDFSYPTPPGEVPEGVFIVCEGNFMYGNATLSFYLPSTGELQNEIFARANGMKLGDVAQSMTIHDGTAYVVVNNSGVIFGIDPVTFRIRRVIRGIGSPRYIWFRGGKAYVTSLYEPRIAVVDVATASVESYIDTPGHTSTEQMVAFGDTLFVSCWSYDDTVLMVDLVAGEVAGEIKVRSQPRQMALDGAGKLWVLTDGGYGEGAAPGPPALYRIDAASGRISCSAWAIPRAGSASGRRAIRSISSTGPYGVWIRRPMSCRSTLSSRLRIPFIMPWGWTRTAAMSMWATRSIISSREWYTVSPPTDGDWIR